MALLDIITAATGELGISEPSIVIGNTDPQIVQLLALANREGKEFAALGGHATGWPELRKETTFNLLPVGPYTGTLTPNSTTITSMSSVVGLVAGYGVGGSNIYASTTISSVGGSSIVVSAAPSVTSVTTGVSLNFGKIAYALPSDMAYPISATYWDRNFRWQMLGPVSAQEWQTMVSGISPVGPRIRFRIMDNLFYIQPLPGTSQTDQIAFEYITNQWCTSATGTGQSVWTADTDLYLWPEDTAVLGLKWRFLRAKGLDYGEEKQTYDRAVERQLARSGGNRSLPMNAQASGLRLLSSQNVPDTGFGT